MKKLVIGIDPGSKVLGYAFVEVLNERKMHIISIGDVRFATHESMPSRLYHVYCHFDKIIQDMIKHYDSITLGIETQFMGKNFRSSEILIHFKTLFLLLAYKYNCILIEITPSEIKKIITGNGHATKEEMATAIKHFFNNLPADISYDCIDALSIAIALN